MNRIWRAILASILLPGGLLVLGVLLLAMWMIRLTRDLKGMWWEFYSPR